MQVSLVIPTLRIDGMVDRCIESFKDQYDELVVVDHKYRSLAEKQNIGMRRSHGDFIIVSNDDVVADEGSLRDLCVEGQVLSPRIKEGTHKAFHAHMFCLPRKVYEEVGGFDESFKGVYYIDSDLWLRLKLSGFEPGISDNVTVSHKHPASTIRRLDERQRSMEDGRAWFVKKWGYEALRDVE
jgi:GT2 family glycosyltransferase